MRFSAESIKVRNSERNTRTCLNPWWDPKSMNVVDDNFMVEIETDLICNRWEFDGKLCVVSQCVYDREILFLWHQCQSNIHSQLRHAPPWCCQIKHWCIILQYRWHQDGMSPETSWIAHALFRIQHATISIDRNSPGASDQDIVLFVAGLVKMGEGVSACLHSIWLTFFLCIIVSRETVSWRVCSSFIVKSRCKWPSTFSFYLSR